MTATLLGEPIKPCFFFIEPLDKKSSGKNELITAALCTVRSVKMDENKVTIEFILTSDNITWSFFLSQSPFSLWWIDHEGKKIDNIEFTSYKPKLFIKEFSHASTDKITIAVAILTDY